MLERYLNVCKKPAGVFNNYSYVENYADKLVNIHSTVQCDDVMADYRRTGFEFITKCFLVIFSAEKRMLG